MVKARQIHPDTPPDLVADSLQFVKELKEMQQKYDLQSTGTTSDASYTNDVDIRSFGWSYQDFFQRMRSFHFEQWIFQRESRGVVQRYLNAIGVLGPDVLAETSETLTVKELDQQHPRAFNKHYELSSAVMIRSYNSRDLPKNTNIL